MTSYRASLTTDEGVTRLTGTLAFLSATAQPLSPNPIVAGALPTVNPVSATPFQCSTTRDVDLIVACTFNPTAGATATVKVELSPDNATYSTLVTMTEPVGVAFAGTIIPVPIRVPAGWFVKLTATNAVLGVGTFY